MGAASYNFFSLQPSSIRAYRVKDGTVVVDPSQGKPRPKQRNAMVSAETLRREAERHPGLLVRTAAAAVLNDIITNGHALDERLSPAAVPNRLTGLDARDRALVRSIVTVSLRRLGTIKQSIAKLLEHGLPRQAAQIEWTLIIAAAQILFMEVPDHAAVDLAVRIVRLETKTAPYASLVNAVLRNIAREREALLSASDPLEHDTPHWLAARWRKTYGEAEAHAIAAAHCLEPTLDLTVKSDVQGWQQKLGGVVLPTGSLRLQTHMPIIELADYDAGEWWVQDAAAALPALLLRLKPGMKVADFCAAPGGKAAQIAVSGADVTAIDRSAERLKILAANFERLHLEAEMIVADVTNVKGLSFDAILIDPPCTGTGTIRRHPDIAWIKKASDIAALAALQARMLDKAAEMVKPGGLIVFCTCSIEPEEGELQIQSFLRRNPDMSRLPIEPAEVGGLSEILNESGEMRTLPSYLQADDPRLSGLDGFFAARLVRSR
jgi:16S rRNA (cytosine967-C5)-methyltransferase